VFRSRRAPQHPELAGVPDCNRSWQMRTRRRRRRKSRDPHLAGRELGESDQSSIIGNAVCDS